MGNEKLTTLARRLRPFLMKQIGDLISGGSAVTEGPDIDLVPVSGGIQVGRGGDTIILFDSGGAPLAEFAMSSAGFNLALAAATAGDVIQIPAGTVSGNHTIPADITVTGFGWNTILSGTITNNGILMFCSVTGTLTNGDLGMALYMRDDLAAGIKINRVLKIDSEGYSAGSGLTAKGTGVTGTEGGAYLTADGRYEGTVQLFCSASDEYKRRYRWNSINNALRAQLQDEYLDTTIRDLMVIDDIGNVTLTDGITINGHLYFNAIIGGCAGDGVTDDTTALQALINTATANGTRSATIYFPPGTYLIGGALQDTGAFNGQILFPNVSISDPQITLRLIGANRPPFAVHGSLPGPGGYSILKSSLTGATGTAACFSGGNGDYPTQNNISIALENLITLSPDNPTFTFWNLSTCQGGSIKNVFTTVVPWTTCSQPTHSNAYGVKLPQWGQSNYTHVDGLAVGGHYTGLLQGELSIVRGYIVGLCIVGVEITDEMHPSLIVDMQMTACTYGIRCTGGAHYADVLQYAAEHYTTPSWAITVYDLDDASNYFNGTITWFGVAAGGTPDHSFTINGGANAHTFEIGEMPALDDLEDVNTAGTGTGDIIYNSTGSAWVDYPMGVGSDIANDGSSIKIGNIAGGNYIQIDTDTGEIALAGDATAWDDLRVSASIAKPGVTAPQYKAFGPSGSLQALMFEAGHHDEVFFEVQMPHNWKVGSDIHPHIHWTPTTADAGNVVWELEYSWCNIDGTFGAPSNMATDATAAGGTAWVHKMTDFKSGGVETISGFGKTLSSMLICRLHRNSNSGSDTLNKDVALLEIDFHYEIDSFGSFDELTKVMASNLLLETGDALLLETGDKLLLE